MAVLHHSACISSMSCSILAQAWCRRSICGLHTLADAYSEQGCLLAAVGCHSWGLVAQQRLQGQQRMLKVVRQAQQALLLSEGLQDTIACAVIHLLRSYIMDCCSCTVMVSAGALLPG